MSALWTAVEAVLALCAMGALLLGTAALVLLAWCGLLKFLDYRGQWLDEHPEVGEKK